MPCSEKTDSVMTAPETSPGTDISSIVTTGGSIGATTSKTLEQSVKLIDEWAEAARKVRKDIIIIAHGGPIATPEDVSYILEHSEHCNGFYGASSVERLPVETAIKSNIEAFKTLRLK